MLKITLGEDMEWEERVRRISALLKKAESSFWLPAKTLDEDVLPHTALVVACLTLIYLMTFKITTYTTKFSDIKVKRKVCYQVTNFCANAILGFTGLYYQLFVISKHPTLEESMEGHENLLIFSYMQLGYQIWALFLIFGNYVTESRSMMFHHMAVLCCGVLPGAMTIGFRYYTPFFFGVMELSSVPLSIMNSFRGQPQLAKRFPTVFLASKLSFAASFIVVRNIWCTPRHTAYLRDTFIVFLQSEGLYQLYMLGVFLSSFFLMSLQLYWGFLIAKGLALLAVPSLQPKKTKAT